jgi:hypothetical protein
VGKVCSDSRGHGDDIYFLLSLKANGEQIDDRIVEVHWNPVGEHWRMMRFRDDKPHGNHRSIVEDIVKSIEDGVEKDTVSTLLASVGATLIVLIPSATRSFCGNKKCLEDATWPATAATATSEEQRATAPAIFSYICFSCI